MKQNPTKRETGQADLDLLELAAAAGDIHLKYLDESGFSLWAQVCYTWAKKGEQKRIEQTTKKGRRLNICGLLEIDKSFEYGLALKNFNSKAYIQLMDWQAQKALAYCPNRCFKEPRFDLRCTKLSAFIGY